MASKRDKNMRKLEKALRSNGGGKKRALLIGLNYAGTRSALRGCINDVKNLKDLLTLKGFTDIITMTDNQHALLPHYPTKANMMREIKNLVSQMKPGDFSVLSYSGHGTTKICTEGEEPSGEDQVLVPADAVNDPSKYIIDDELYEIVSKVVAGATMFIICDSCFSGTSFDLPYIADCDRETCSLKPGQGRPAIPGCVIELSGCSDYQTSADITSAGKSYGAMTNAFLSSYTDGIEYRNLLLKVRRYLSANGHRQTPQLTFGNPTKFDGKLSLL